MQRESRTSGELLLPVSRRPSHWEMISQRNNGAPSRIPNRISPWWFTWQTVALLLCSWILTHTMPRRHLLIEIALSQFIKGDQTDHMSQKPVREGSQAWSISEAVNNKVRPMVNSHPINLFLMVNSHPIALFLMVNSHPIALPYGELSPPHYFS